MSYNHPTSRVLNTNATATRTPDSGASSDTLFRLECVLLFALDVVKGPYIHSCAPTNPPEAIWSFLQSPGMLSSFSTVAAACPAAAGSGVGKPSTQSPPPARMIQTNSSAEVRVGGDLVLSESELCTGAGLAMPTMRGAGTCGEMPSARVPPFEVDCIAGGGGGLAADFSSSSGLRTPRVSSPALPPMPLETSTLAAPIDVSPSSKPPSLHQSSCTSLLSQQLLSFPSLLKRSSPAADLSETVSGDVTSDRMRNGPPSLLVQPRFLRLSDPTTPDGANTYAMSTSRTNPLASVDGSVFPAPTQTFATESHQQARQSIPLAGGLSMSVESQSTGGGDMFAQMTNPSENGGDLSRPDSRHHCDLDGEVPHAGEGKGGVDGGVSPIGELGTPGTAVGGVGACSSSTSSATRTSSRVPPMAATYPCVERCSSTAVSGVAAEKATEAERQQQLQRHTRRHPTHPLPSFSEGRPSLTFSAIAASTPTTQAAATAAATATPAVDSNRMGASIDVFVPRSEFCRRVLWLYPAESGVLFLYYPEDIPGEHYQRKTLRYSLCFVFRVDSRRITIGDGLLHQLVHPYSVVLTHIAEELREAELKYAYMLRGLRHFTMASPRTSISALTPSIPSLAPLRRSSSRVAAPPLVASFTASVLAESSQEFEEGSSQSHGGRVSARLLGASSKADTLACPRTTEQTNGTTLSPATAKTGALVGNTVLNLHCEASAYLASETAPLTDHSDAIVSVVAPSQQLAAAAAGEIGSQYPLAEVTSCVPTTLISLHQPRASSLNVRIKASGTSDAVAASATDGIAPQEPEAGAGGVHNPPDGGDGPLLQGLQSRLTFSSSAAGAAALLSADPRSSVPGLSVTGGGGGAGPFISTCMTGVEAGDETTPVPSSRPLRSRTRSETAVASPPSTARAQQREDATCPGPDSSVAFSPYSSVAAPASSPLVTLSGTLSHSQTQQQQQQQQTSTAGAASPAPLNVLSSNHVPTSAMGASGTGGSATSPSSMHILNAFITPPTAPQWTPLNDLVQELFRCLSCTSETTAADGEIERGGQRDSPAGGRYTPRTTPPASSDAIAEPMPQRATPTSLSSPTVQQQQRGDTGVVHLSNRLSFHVRRMTPLQPARLLHLDYVGVPIVAYDPTMVEWMDMAVHDVFRLVDGVRTVADVVFSIALGTTTTLAEVYAEALERGIAELAVLTASPTSVGAPAAQRNATASVKNVRNRSAAVKANVAHSVSEVGAAEARGSGESAAEAAGAAGRWAGVAEGQHPSVFVSVPINSRSHPSLLPGARYSIPASVAAATSDGLVSLPNHVNVRLAPSAASDTEAQHTGVNGRSGFTSTMSLSPGVPHRARGSATPAVSSPPSPQISMELPPTWVATTGMVMEALLHLELCHLIKVYRPWTDRTRYSTTRTAQRVLRSARHPARHLVARYLLYVAWREQQERREERRRVVAELQRVHKKQTRAERGARKASTPFFAATSATAENQLGNTGPENSTTERRCCADEADFSVTGALPHTAAADPLGVASASRLGSRGAASSASAAVAVPSSNQIVTRNGWPPTASVRRSPTASYMYDLQRSGSSRQLPYDTVSATRSTRLDSLSLPLIPRTDPAQCDCAGSLSYAGEVDESRGHRRTSFTRSLAPSSLRHSLTIGASGRLQLTLRNSPTTSPLQRPDRSTANGMARGIVPRNAEVEASANDRMPSSLTAVSHSSGPSPLLRQQVPHPDRRSETHGATLRSCRSISMSSTTSSDSSGGMERCPPRSSKSSSSMVSSERHARSSSSVSSSSSSLTPTYEKAALYPLTSLAAVDGNAAQDPAEAPHVHTSTLNSPKSSAADAKVGAPLEVDTLTANTAVGATHYLFQSPCDTGTMEQRTHDPAISSALGGLECSGSCVTPAEVSSRERQRRYGSPPKAFAPTDADVSHAAAAALCALAKFTNTSVPSVQGEMQRIPVWATSFNGWSPRCVKALVEVAILNDWLEEVP